MEIDDATVQRALRAFTDCIDGPEEQMRDALEASGLPELVTAERERVDRTEAAKQNRRGHASNAISYAMRLERLLNERAGIPPHWVVIHEDENTVFYRKGGEE